MKTFITRKTRKLIQLLVNLIIVTIIIAYSLYTSEVLSFKIIGISDMNPYGGWSALRELLTDSSYAFEGNSMSIALTIALLIMAVIGGRFFCGWICPIGTLQDFSAWIGKKLGVIRYKGLRIKSFDPIVLKYIFLLLLLLISVLGFGAVIADISPWRAFLSLPRFTVTWLDMKLGFAVLIAILVVSVFISRFFCRYLCPLGAAQTLFCSFSLFSIRHEKGCSKCNKCLEKCPVGLNYSTESNIISPECIRCLECVDDCKVNSNNRVQIGFLNKKAERQYYIPLMLILLLLIWIGVPQLWGGHASSEDISLGVLKDGSYIGESRGFATKITTEVRITDGKITEIKVIDHKESKGWYEEVFMVIPEKIIKKQRLNVDVISGATKSSKGLIYSIENAVRKAINE